MKSIVVICTLLMFAGRSYSQDGLKKENILPILKEFSTNSIRLNYYKQLPDFIRNFLDQMERSKKFNISKKVVNDAYVSGSKRKLRYILKSKESYLLGYDHGGVGHHFHSIIFITNGKEISTVYNLIVSNTHQSIDVLIEHIEKGWYYIQEMKEY